MNQALRNLILFAATVFSVQRIPATETETVAAVLWAEARGEGAAGIQAVAEVTRNRTQHPARWSSTAFGVVIQSKQFSCLNGTTPEAIISRAKSSTGIDQAAWKHCLRVARALESSIFSGNSVNGATHYTVGTPVWAKGMKLCATVGKHNFFK